MKKCLGIVVVLFALVAISCGRDREPEAVAVSSESIESMSMQEQSELFFKYSPSSDRCIRAGVLSSEYRTNDQELPWNLRNTLAKCAKGREVSKQIEGKRMPPEFFEFANQ